MIKKILNRIFCEIKYKYLFNKSIVVVKRGGSIYIGKDVKIISSRIYVAPESKIIINNNTIIRNTNISVKGSFEVNESCIFDSTNRKNSLHINGNASIGNHTRIRCVIWMRFNSFLKIGSYTNINEGSEIRVDEKVEIGDFNQISYNVNIWDTNTHNIYPKDVRRKIAIEYYPIFGHEYEKPKTSPIIIGDDCWISKEVTILKGVEIGNEVIIGYRTTLSNCKITDSQKVFTKINNVII